MKGRANQDSGTERGTWLCWSLEMIVWKLSWKFSKSVVNEWEVILRCDCFYKGRNERFLTFFQRISTGICDNDTIWNREGQDCVDHLEMIVWKLYENTASQMWLEWELSDFEMWFVVSRQKRENESGQREGQDCVEHLEMKDWKLYEHFASQMWLEWELKWFWNVIRCFYKRIDFSLFFKGYHQESLTLIQWNVWL
jgi:hypothetical protein